MVPRERQLLGTRPTDNRLRRLDTVDNTILRKSPEKVVAELRALEERLAHELMDDEERQELWDRVIALRRHLGR
jgi:CRISPR/Cas system type I-B associated protein Csh2 (Cas7 group RAMP superfamily)